VSQVAQSDIDYYQKHGAVCLRDALDSHWIDLLRRGVEHNVANPSKFFANLVSEGESTFIMDYNSWTTNPLYQEVIHHSPLAETAGRLMDWEEVNFLEDNLFCSSNGQSEPTKWHQDSSYYEIVGSVCSIWVPLDDVIAEDCIAIVAGSHRWGNKFLPTSFSGKRERICDEADLIPPQFKHMPDIDGEIDNYEILRWDMKVGDCIALHGDVIHGKFRSNSGRPLRRITLRFVGQDCYWNKNDLPWQELEMGHDGLQPGDRLNSELFPLVWSRRAESS
jgi:ectoine hydroxylase-related dioxygenase (phytanoyl-CoA dioxygenase family)